MLNLKLSVPVLARMEDKRLYESAYALPSEVDERVSCNSASTLTSGSTHLSSRSQRSFNLTGLQFKQKAVQKQNDKDSTKVCFVCWSKDCKLKSHQEYAFRQKSSIPNSSSRKAGPPLPQIKFSLPIGNGRLDPFTALPVDGPSTEALQLFHDFFGKQASQVYEFPRRLAFDATYQPLLFQQAYTDSATCHSCIAMGATYVAVHGRNLRTPDKELSAFYESALRALRAQLIREKAKPRAATVMAAVNLIMAQAIGMCDKDALSAHRTGIESFVKAWGGIHNLEPQVVGLIIWTDYWATLFTGIPPLYTHLLSRMDIKLENPPPRRCGNAFEEPRMRGITSPMLLENCQITCRLIELVEEKVDKRSTPARWHYFTYKRDCMATRNAVVHSELFGAGSRSECIGLAINMILVLVLRMVPWKSPANELCDQMKIALIASGAGEHFWRMDIDVLLYILFILSAAGENWDHRSWAIDLLQQTLEAKYGPMRAEWPKNWEEQETFNLRRFAWSSVLLESAFHDTCRELDFTQHSDPVDDLEHYLDEDWNLADDEGSDDLL